jgi:hypothetical protein
MVPEPSSVLDWRLILSLAIPALVAIGGLIGAHWLGSRRELANRRREARLQALSKAFMKLAMFVRRTGPPSDQAIHDFEEFVAEIQLYGTASQLALMHRLVDEMKVPNSEVSFDAILESLRDDLRRELRLAEVTGGVWWFRFNRQPPAAAAK